MQSIVIIPLFSRRYLHKSVQFRHKLLHSTHGKQKSLNSIHNQIQLKVNALWPCKWYSSKRGTRCRCVVIWEKLVYGAD